MTTLGDKPRPRTRVKMWFHFGHTNNSIAIHNKNIESHFSWYKSLVFLRMRNGLENNFSLQQYPRDVSRETLRGFSNILAGEEMQFSLTPEIVIFLWWDCYWADAIHLDFIFIWKIYLVIFNNFNKFLTNHWLSCT